MSRPMQRLGDSNSGGGMVTQILQNTVFAEGTLVVTDGSTGTGHGNGIHANGAWATMGGSNRVFVNNTPVTRTGDQDSCGHVRIGGSNTIFLD